MTDKASLDLTRAVFTDHALEQFCRRMHHLDGYYPKKPAVLARKLLSRALESPPSRAEAVARKASNGDIDARYLTLAGWRFVVVIKRGLPLVVTIERMRGRESC